MPEHLSFAILLRGAGHTSRQVGALMGVQPSTVRGYWKLAIEALAQVHTHAAKAVDHDVEAGVDRLTARMRPPTAEAGGRSGGAQVEVSQDMYLPEAGGPLDAIVTVTVYGDVGEAVRLRLRLWTPTTAAIRFFKQVYPETVDLTPRRTDVSARVGDYPTGPWGSVAIREYHLSMAVSPGVAGDEIRAARISVMHRDDVLADGVVLAMLTADTATSTEVNQPATHHTWQAELDTVIYEGLTAWEVGDEATATAMLGRAVQLAIESGRGDTVRALARVVEVVDAPTGTVRLKRRPDSAHLAAVASRMTRRFNQSEPPPSGSNAESHRDDGP